MIYIDSNIFIYATMDEGEKGEWCENILNKVQNGETIGVTSALTFNELFWKVKKEKGFDSAIIAGKAFLKMSNLNFIAVDDQILWATLELIKQYKLEPRDAIHAACALTYGVNEIYSEDYDFDKISGLSRIWLNYISNKN